MAVTFILSVLYGLKDFLTFQGWGATEIKITTSLVKFNNFADGHYEKKGDKIILKFFEDERDFVVAEEVRIFPSQEDTTYQTFSLTNVSIYYSFVFKLPIL